MRGARGGFYAPACLLVLALVAGCTTGPTGPSIPSVPATSSAPTATARSAGSGAPASTGTAPAGSAVPTSSPVPAGSPSPVALAITRAFAADPLVMHVTTSMVGAVRGSSPTSVSLIESIDIAGSSIAIHRVAAAGTRREVQDEIHIGTAVYTSTDGGLWSVKTAPEQVTRDLEDELRLVTDPQLLLVGGLEERGGEQLLHVTAAGVIPYRTATPGGGHYDAWDLWATPAGLPVLARLTFTSTDGNGNPLTGSIDYQFDHVGGPITISPPLVNGSPLPTPEP